MPIISLRNVTKVVESGGEKIPILQNISLDIEDGEFIAIIGQSGSGKSSLLNLLGCLDVPDSGSYLLGDRDIFSLTSAEQAAVRSTSFGFIFQQYLLLDALSVQDNVSLPGVYSGMPRAKRRALSSELLSQLGVLEKSQSSPHELSGGQQQRVCIARALFNGAKIILADEPTGALDSKNGARVIETLRSLNKQGRTVVLVTHDTVLAQSADRVIQISDGKIVEEQTHAEARERSAAGRSVFSSMVHWRHFVFEVYMMALRAIKAHRIRSILTCLSILIGIASFVFVMALGEASEKQIVEDLQNLGSNVLTIFPGEGFGSLKHWQKNCLTLRDSQRLSRQNYVLGVSPVMKQTGRLVSRGYEAGGEIIGVNTSYFEAQKINLETGRLFTGKEVAGSASVVIIGAEARKVLFPFNEKIVGHVLFFAGVPLRIIGVAQEQRTPFLASDSLMVWVPHSTMQHKITGTAPISFMTVQLKPDVAAQSAEKQITSLLVRAHGMKKDFFIFNSDQLQKTVRRSANTLSLLMQCISFVSLLVGGVGVMNIMFVSVAERTREIGVCMALGARRQQICMQFLTEAIMLCFIGGALGVISAFGANTLYATVMLRSPLTYSVWIIACAFACATVIGFISGIIPAIRASKLQPVTALRYE
ncbi:ABC transporter permease [Halodesulfovibrio spirochaetisodalis]|uniref:Pyoverdine export ATP-binding/permease protein PvdT n=1 Tax=Halodesulfovibrio spirochaetisodalis TaxID=1560234 RepID=A0A1B7XFM8_9BACT|nr:ABC transporter permease [Halodesulfovibrio spirochaetisodalis]OBQ54079.1 hypothetical protein SP90_06345 [Halodesulfovibrio spirochaetisodalis]